MIEFLGSEVSKRGGNRWRNARISPPIRRPALGEAKAVADSPAKHHTNPVMNSKGLVG